MLDSTAPVPATAPAARGAGALYRAAWRWHFYAGILAAPLAIFLAVTGGLYLWKPQYEAWRYRELFTVPALAATVPVNAQFTAARAVFPKATPVAFTPSFKPGKTSELVVRVVSPGAPANLPPWAGERTTIFINPHTGAVVGRLADADRVMNTLHDLHGELLAGKAGSFVVELAASWIVVLVLSGFYLWWPRPVFAVWGFLLPRLRAKGRIFWRDVHAVPTVWISLGALFLVATGIPWTNVGGRWFRTVAAVIGEDSPKESNASAHRSELTGWSPPLKAGLAAKIDTLASKPVTADDALSLDIVQIIAKDRAVPEPYAIALPSGPTGVYSVLSDRNQAFKRAYLHLDQYSGQVLADIRYPDHGLMSRFVLWGLVAHEGQLFGLANQLLGTLACAGIVLMAASGLWLWWQRRPAGKLAAPVSDASLPRPVFYGTLVIALVLPLLAGSLILLWLIDQIVMRVRRASPLPS